MNRLILIAALIFLLFLPEKDSTTIEWNELEPYAYAGLLTALPAEQEEEAPKPPDDPEHVSDCPCNGTGYVSYDGGGSKMPCPCDENCECKRGKQERGSTFGENLAETPARYPRVVMATEPSYCPPCRRFETEVVKGHLLKKAYVQQGWTVGEEDTDSLQVLEFSTHRDFFDKLNLSRTVQTRGVPFFFRLHEDGTVEEHLGYMDIYEFVTFYKKGNQTASYQRNYSQSYTLDGEEWPSKQKLILHLRTNHGDVVGNEILEGLDAKNLKWMHDDIEQGNFGKVIWTSKN